MKAAFQILHTSTFLSHQFRKTYWRADLASTYAETELGKRKGVVISVFMRKLKFGKSASPGGFLFPAWGTNVWFSWAPRWLSVIIPSTVDAKCLLVTEDLGFPICKTGLKSSSQYYRTSYMKAFCKMKKFLLVLIWMPSLHSEHRGDWNQHFHPQGT